VTCWELRGQLQDLHELVTPTRVHIAVHIADESQVDSQYETCRPDVRWRVCIEGLMWPVSYAERVACDVPSS
jgi:hypothetical protein